MSNAIGIDLGTTNSVVAYVNAQGLPEVIPNREGGRTTPSVFAVTEDGSVLSGKPAVDQEAMNPAQTVRSIKRRMGTADRLEIAGRVWSPEEISAEILKKLKADAEAYLGRPVSDAVITVPAYFNNDQRQSTKTAGELAGLNVLRIINEPTAASLAYGLGRHIDQTVLVYDLGGGTFDVTLLKIAEGMDFHVQATAGDTRLGGDDFDSSLMHRLLASLPSVQEMTDEQRVRLREAAEQAKKELSSAHQAIVNVPYFAFEDGKPVHVRETLTRTQFEESIAPLVERTKKCVDQAMRDAGLSFKGIDEVVFVGGSTRVPFIGESVEQWTGRRPNRSVNPDEAVAIGAAIQADVLSGGSAHEVFLVDVTPLSLGVETQGGVMDVLIRRNTTVPCESLQTYTTSTDNQPSVDVKVFQGERPQTRDNKKLGEFQLEDIPPAPRGVPKIDVAFEIDANGILSVRAMDQLTGVNKEVVLTGSSSLTSEEIQRMLGEAEQNKSEDQKFILISNLRAVVCDQLIQTEELLRTDVLSEEAREDLADLRASLEEAQESSNIELMTSLVDAAKETLKEASSSVYARAQALVG